MKTEFDYFIEALLSARQLKMYRPDALISLGTILKLAKEAKENYLADKAKYENEKPFTW